MDAERKEKEIVKKKTDSSQITIEETINLIELDEDVDVKQEFIEDGDQNLTIEKIAASKGLIGALHELQLGTNLTSAKKKAGRQTFSFVYILIWLLIRFYGRGIVNRM